MLPYTSDMSSLRDTLERVVVVSEGEVRFPKGLSGWNMLQGADCKPLQLHSSVAVVAVKFEQQMEISAIQVYEPHSSACQREEV